MDHTGKDILESIEDSTKIKDVLEKKLYRVLKQQPMTYFMHGLCAKLRRKVKIQKSDNKVKMMELARAVGVDLLVVTQVKLVLKKCWNIKNQGCALFFSFVTGKYTMSDNKGVLSGVQIKKI
ncbi:hypothetical protein CR513_40638, partial [Mucuna pruriens]